MKSITFNFYCITWIPLVFIVQFYSSKYIMHFIFISLHNLSEVCLCMLQICSWRKLNFIAIFIQHTCGHFACTTCFIFDTLINYLFSTSSSFLSFSFNNNSEIYRGWCAVFVLIHTRTGAQWQAHYKSSTRDVILLKNYNLYIR